LEKQINKIEEMTANEEVITKSLKKSAVIDFIKFVDANYLTMHFSLVEITSVISIKSGKFKFEKNIRSSRRLNSVPKNSLRMILNEFA
jgi:hypothetical protein